MSPACEQIATISYRSGQFFVTDKRSKTRTFVNQTKLEPTDKVLVREGDEIEIVSDQKSTIFRLTRTGVSDFRPPRKAGLWWVRYSGRLFVLLSLVSFVVAAGAIGLYVKNQKAISEKPGTAFRVDRQAVEGRRMAAGPLSRPYNHHPHN